MRAIAEIRLKVIKEINLICIKFCNWGCNEIEAQVPMEAPIIDASVIVYYILFKPLLLSCALLLNSGHYL